ncbi:RHS repeat-associated core domain-containing protein [Amycolatopsis sp. VS8301801F10]|uniref:RHS repeat-associated core domain-containing protein n=1 Tax=Amycolatopsis sp. VS8301801F10 TaxID=2652442 RepID=UPI0038FC4F9F
MPPIPAVVLIPPAPRDWAERRTTGPTTPLATGLPRPHAIQALDTTGPNGSSHSAYTYDPSGRTLTQGPAGAGQTFTYDADGNLLLTKGPTGTTLKLNDLELFRGTGTSTTVGTRFYTFNGAPIAERDANAGLTWSMTDTQNTAYATVKADTLAVTQRWQDPYGVPRGPAPSLWPDKHGYLGGYRNTTGLTHLGAREYDPALGRFTTVDPVLKTDDPQQMNGYSYANDNPIGLTDPSGLCPGVPDGACRRPDGSIGGGDACRNGGWSCDRPDNPSCGCRAAQQHPANHGAPASSGGHGQAAPKKHAASGGGGSDGGGEKKSSGNWFLNALSDIGEGLYEVSGLQDVVDGCFRDPAVVGCIKGVLEVGVWFVPGGAAARGTELAVSGGAHLIEGEVGAEGRAVAEDLAASCKLNSFAGDTPVLMADGTMKPIEQVKVGDKVRNAEPDNTSTEIHTVTALHITDTDRDFVDVTIATPNGPKKITSTAHHRWWDVTTHSWTDAADLRPSDLLDTPGDGHAAVQTLSRYATSIRTYNLTVDTTHTYYVAAGATPVLVHNCNERDPVHGGLEDAAYDRIDNAYGPDIADGVDYQVKRMHDGSAASADHDLPGIGHDPDALAAYFASWRGKMTHKDTKTGSSVAYDSRLGVLIVTTGRNIHGYRYAQGAFESGRYVTP